ncbi:hypothetical protein D3C84_1273340 [compost metagenome]
MMSLLQNGEVEVYAKQVFSLAILVTEHTGNRADFLPIPVDFLVRTYATCMAEIAQLLFQC